MLKFAIVGNIACGKSTVEKYLINHGFKVFDTDILSHEILYNSKTEVISAFEGYDIVENEDISRKKLGDIIFQNNDLKIKLENIIYPKLKNKILEIFEQNNTEKYVFISIPLLFEVGWENLFDRILFIQTDDNIRLERLMDRNGFNQTEAKRRIDAQMSQKEKIKKADFIICNNETREMLQNEIEQFIIQLEEME